MTRTVADNALMLRAIAGRDGRDPGSIDEPVPDYLGNLDGDVRGMRIGVERAYFFGGTLWPQVRQAVESVIAELEDAGAEVIDIRMPEMDLMGVTGMTILLAEASAEHRSLLRTRGDRLDPATRVMLELGEMVPATHYALAQRARAQLQTLTRLLYTSHGLDVLISPTLPTTTMPVEAMNGPDESGEDPMTDAIMLTWPANVTGLPALTIPCGFSDLGLPIGVQLMGRPFDESRVYRLARAYERRHDWSARRPPLDVNHP